MSQQGHQPFHLIEKGSYSLEHPDRWMDRTTSKGWRPSIF